MDEPCASVMLFAKDVPRLADFYCAVLGLEARTTSEPGFLELCAGAESIVALHALPDEVAARVTIADPPAARGDIAVKPRFRVADLEAVRAAVLTQGARAEAIWSWEGRRFCDCVDPEGNVFQLLGGGRPERSEG